MPPQILTPQSVDRERQLAQFLLQGANRQPTQGPGTLIGNLAQVFAGSRRLNAADEGQRQLQGQDRDTLAGILANLPGGAGMAGGQNLADILSSQNPALQGVGQALLGGRLKGDEDLLSPEAFEQQMGLRTAGRPSTTVNVGPQGQDFGDPPKDTVWARNPDRTVATEQFTLPDGRVVQRPISVPIVGGTVDAAAAEAAGKEAGRQATAETAARTVVEDIDFVLEAVREAPATTTGSLSQVLRFFPTRARSISGAIETIKANAAFDRLSTMRENSPTGGALGAISDPERQALADTIGALDQPGESGFLIRNLERVKRQYLDIIHGPVGSTTPDVINRLSAPQLEEWLLSVEQRGGALTNEQFTAVEQALTRLGL